MNYPVPPQAPARSGFPVWLVVVLVVVVLVVAGVSVLATLAIYGTRKYIANAKNAEAKNSLAMIAKDAVAAYESRGSLCPSASSPIPTVVPRAAKYQSVPLEWEADKAKGAGFACLKFSLAMPQYYQYDYKATPAGFTATARGDLDGDGKESVFVLEGHVQGGQVVMDPTIRETSPEE
jgi:type IV pilus assembly protein PilA